MPRLRRQALLPHDWLGRRSAPVSMVVVLGADGGADTEAVVQALLDALDGDLRVRVVRAAIPATMVTIAGEPYEGPLRFVCLLAAVLSAVRAFSLPSAVARREVALRVSIACIRSALDCAARCDTASELRAWLDLASSEGSRLARLVACPGSSEAAR